MGSCARRSRSLTAPSPNSPRFQISISHFRVSFLPSHPTPPRPNQPTTRTQPARLAVPQHRRQDTNWIRISRPFPSAIDRSSPRPAPAAASRARLRRIARARDGADPRRAPPPSGLTRDNPSGRREETRRSSTRA